MRVWDIAQAQTDIQSDMQSYISSQTDLLANYRLNEGTGTTANDNSGNGNTGTLSGGVTFDNNVVALQFNGSSSYISNTLNTAYATNAVTLEAWVKAEANGGLYQEILRMDDGSDHGCDVEIKNDGYIAVNVRTDGGWTGTSSSSVITDGSWHHVALVVDGNYWLYVDGSIAGWSTASGMDVGSTEMLYIGKHPTAGNFYKGLIREVRVWNCGRTTQQINDNMHKHLVGNETGLVGYYPLSDGFGTTAFDKTSNANNGTLTNFTLDGGTTDGWIIPSTDVLPVELTSFTATVLKNAATLAWKTATEVNNYGFDVERRVVESVSSGIVEWTKVGFVKGNGTSSSAHSYSYTDASVASGTYAYRLKQIDNSGSYKYSSEAEVTIAVPKEFALHQNYPNPFNPTTIIAYDIPAVVSQHVVTLKVYDIIGREVATLVNEVKEAGSYEVKFDVSKFASGIYFYRLSAGNYSAVKKLTFLK